MSPSLSLQGLLVVRVSLDSQCLCHHESSCDLSETWAILVKAEAPVAPESPVSLECPDVQVSTEPVQFFK